MNDEQFAQLLEMVGNAGEGGFVLALVYLFEGYFYALLWGSVITILSIKIGGILRSVSDADRALRDIWDELLPGKRWAGYNSFDEDRRKHLFAALERTMKRDE